MDSLRQYGGSGFEKKSVWASAGLSLVLGPIGWLYAAPLKEAVPGLVIQLLSFWLIPNFLLS